VSEKRVFTIGRDPACHIVLADEKVSKKHAEIAFLEGGKIQLIDQNSTNGTFILKGKEFKKIQKASFISPPDLIRFGPCQMKVKDLLEYLQLMIGPEFATPLLKKTKVAGVKLVRCLCGHIKKPGEPCPNCGQDTEDAAKR